MNTNLKYIAYILLFLLSSCTDETVINDPIIRAVDVVEENPTLALAMLDSIDNPNLLEKESRMQYIVTLVQAKNKLNIDVSGDTLIFQAQEYYNQINEPKMAALANICAGAVHLKIKQVDLAIKSYLKGTEYALENNDDLSLGKIYHNIGFIYFTHDVIDSSIIYYHKALPYFEKVPNTVSIQLVVLRNTGRAYAAINDYENAYNTFYQGLILAEKTNDLIFQSHFNHLLGVALRDMGKYNESENYLNIALKMTTTSADSLRIYLNFSKLYNFQNKPEQAEKYLAVIKDRLGEVKDDYVLQSIYGSLSEYYKQTDNLKEALRYNELRRITDKKIVRSSEALRIVKASQEYVIENKDNEIKELNYQIILYIIIIGLVVILCARMIWYMIKSGREEKLQEELEIAIQRMHVRNMRELARTYEESLTGIILLNENIQTIRKDHDGDNELISRVKKRMIDAVRESVDFKIIDWAKDYVSELPFGKTILKQLSDTEILLLVLSCYKYSDMEISAIVHIPEVDIQDRLSEVKKKLKDIELTDSQIELMFSVGDM